MSVQRIDPDRIRLVDIDGDRIDFHRYRDPADLFSVVVIVDGMPIGITLADGLELLSFLADALGVTGTEPGEPTP